MRGFVVFLAVPFCGCLIGALIGQRGDGEGDGWQALMVKEMVKEMGDVDTHLSLHQYSPSDHYTMSWYKAFMSIRLVERPSDWEERLPQLSSKLAQQLSSRLSTRHAAGSPFVSIHIGPMLLDKPKELDAYSQLFGAQSGLSRAIFVEANPAAAAELRQRMQELNKIPGLVIEIINAAICDHCEGNVSFYTVSPTFEDTFGTPRQNFTMELGSMDKDFTIKTLRHNYPNHPLPNDIDEWIIESPIRCHTLAGLLRETRLEPEAVDSLIVDAEGYDFRIVNEAMTINGFLPAEIQFDFFVGGQGDIKYYNTQHYTVLIPTLVKLVAKGYDVFYNAHDINACLKE